VTGTIERLMRDKRAGFIAADDGHDYLFHEGALRDVTYEELHERDRVMFEIIRGPVRSRAELVRRVRSSEGGEA
jgi:cold shock CspA family protein